MRKLSFGPRQAVDPIAEQRFRDIEGASKENDPIDIASAFNITGSYTVTRTLNASTATLADVRNFIATLVDDLKRGGTNRTV